MFCIFSLLPPIDYFEVNVALALSRMNQKVAVVDADIYGPSIPRLLNLTSESPEATEGNSLLFARRSTLVAALLQHK